MNFQFANVSELNNGVSMLESGQPKDWQFMFLLIA